jgi:hypothetical protein
LLLDGEGGYQGLVTVLERQVAAANKQMYGGVIMDACLLPPTPENITTE